MVESNITTSSSTVVSTQMDSSSPYYLHPSDSPAKNKVGFIDGTNKSPEITSTDFNLWSRCNDMVTFWLLNSLSRDISDSVIYSKSAEDLWNDLEARGKDKVVKSVQNERLIQFLMGLNDAYVSIKSNIIMMSPLPSVSQAYALLIQDEKQREVFVQSHFPNNS
ncbi:uncharacterized protein LOC132031841 [Lycium ferocissimum]|uniref:uncharacterized protein LOC132031841 n=1 Tax=Lycium ferocissimum TaxID=112874 RepID=UPI00281633F5|nr:uncharacterized protein LOC132031841 [Lycium ferocissimum]